MATTDRTFPHYKAVRIKLIELKDAFSLEPESAKKAIALEVFIEMCDASDRDMVSVNFAEATQEIINRLSKGVTKDAGEFGYNEARGLLGIALGAYEQLQGEYMASRRSSA